MYRKPIGSNTDIMELQYVGFIILTAWTISLTVATHKLNNKIIALLEETNRAMTTAIKEKVRQSPQQVPAMGKEYYY